jgi:hypothetical protein
MEIAKTTEATNVEGTSNHIMEYKSVVVNAALAAVTYVILAKVTEVLVTKGVAKYQSRKARKLTVVTSTN